MKITKTLAIVSAAVMACSAMPIVNCSAIDYAPKPSYTKEITVDFVILGYKEKDGELTITSCFDYDPIFCCNGGYIAVCVFNSELTVPAYIDGKPVTAIKNLSGCDTIKKLLIPECIDCIYESAYKGCSYITEYTDKEISLATIYISR